MHNTLYIKLLYIYIHIHLITIIYIYMYHTFLLRPIIGLLDEVPSCSLQFRSAGVGLCDGQPYIEPQPRGHHFLATVEW